MGPPQWGLPSPSPGDKRWSQSRKQSHQAEEAGPDYRAAEIYSVGHQKWGAILSRECYVEQGCVVTMQGETTRGFLDSAVIGLRVQQRH